MDVSELQLKISVHFDRPLLCVSNSASRRADSAFSAHLLHVGLDPTPKEQTFVSNTVNNGWRQHTVALLLHVPSSQSLHRPAGGSSGRWCFDMTLGVLMPPRRFRLKQHLPPELPLYLPQLIQTSTSAFLSYHAISRCWRMLSDLSCWS